MAESGRPPQARALLQQCLHARLQVRPAEGDAAAQWVEVMSAPQLRLSCGAQGRFLTRCLGDFCPRVSLRAGRLAPGTCCGRGGAGLTAGPPNAALSSCLASPLSSVQRGLVIYVCFFKGADKELLPKMGMCLMFLF
ncbi:hypothetical protein J1605_014863 [Eschrichtius robustus]|uniref:Uncharacterized protein n=1 Tax=Eschrichtius robustus TaxID=9764 RepID=A0AB34GD76_ESCRO|nr:hypothetical protein J1605_014863 [Eschrichtius robustus]